MQSSCFLNKSILRCYFHNKEYKMALGNVTRGRREVGRGSRGRGMIRGQGRGIARGPGVGTFRGPGAALPSRRPLGVDTRPSSVKIAKASAENIPILSNKRETMV